MKGSAFRIPSIEEVKSFMNICKPDWPTSFIAYYSERWMLHYMANGFIVGKVKMKDWKACIRSQWLTIKYKEDKDRLESDLKSWQHKVLLDERRRDSAGMFAEQETAGDVKPFERVLQFLDGIQASFFEGTATEVQLRSACETLRGWKMLRLRKEQIEKIVVDQGNNADFGKILAIRAFFGNLKASGLTVSSFVKSKIEKV